MLMYYLDCQKMKFRKEFDKRISYVKIGGGGGVGGGGLQ